MEPRPGGSAGAAGRQRHAPRRQWFLSDARNDQRHQSRFAGRPAHKGAHRPVSDAHHRPQTPVSPDATIDAGGDAMKDGLNGWAVDSKDASGIEAEPVFHTLSDDREVLLLLLYQREAASKFDCRLSYSTYTGEWVEDDVVFEGVVGDDFFGQLDGEDGRVAFVIGGLDIPDIGAFVVIPDARCFDKFRVRMRSEEHTS